MRRREYVYVCKEQQFFFFRYYYSLFLVKDLSQDGLSDGAISVALRMSHVSPSAGDDDSASPTHVTVRTI